MLDDTVPAALTGPDDGFSSVVDDDPVQQQRKDMVLSSVNDGSGGGSAGDQRIVAIGHAVDRVLFPLPVGDVLATMRADRQRRYSVFLRAVDEYCSSSVRNLLSGTFVHPPPPFSFLRDNVDTAGGIKGHLPPIFPIVGRKPKYPISTEISPSLISFIKGRGGGQRAMAFLRHFLNLL